MIGEDSKDNLIKKPEIVIEEWHPDFYRDFQLNEEEDLVTIRCPSWFMKEVEEEKKSGAQNNFELLALSEEPRIEFVKTMNLPEYLRNRVIDQIKKETTVNAVKAGEDWGMFLAKLKVLPYLYELFIQALIDLEAKKSSREKSIKIESFKVAQRFSVISDLRSEGKIKFEVVNDS